MAMLVQCPNPACQAGCSVADANGGSPVRCPKCHKPFVVKPTVDWRKGDTNGSKPSSGDNPFPVLPAEFGRYRVLKLLGRGGMGAVYLAHDSQLGRQVALKVPFFGAGDSPQRAERFVREARSAAVLQHPNICTLFDAGQIDGRPFLTMAFIAGTPLEDLIDPESPMPQARAAEIACKIALALDHAHRAGIVHRDLKPANVMMAAGGEPVVMDFGLAKRVADVDPKEAKLTRLGGLLGTPSYMAPEQCRGEASAVGPATDVYALGVMLFEMLTGRTPFTGGVTVVIGRILTSPVPPLREFRPDADPRLDAICQKALAKDPAARFQSMAEFAEALSGYLKPPTAAPAPASLAGCSPLDNQGNATRPEPGSKKAKKGQSAASPSPSPQAVTASRAAASTAPARRASPDLQAPLVGKMGPILAGMAAFRLQAAPLLRKKWPIIAGAAACLLLAPLLVLWAGGAFRLKTNDGTIVLENLPADSEVFVDGEKIALKLKGDGKPIEIQAAPGKRKLEIKTAGFRMETQELTLAAGERKPIGIRLEPLAAAAEKAAAPDEITNSVGMKLKLIPPGTFLMGSPKDEQDREDDEGPQHEVEITKAFYLGACPVTRGQFALFVKENGYHTEAEKNGGGGHACSLETHQWEQKPEYTWRHPGFPQDDNHPVVQVSWNDAMAYCSWLSKKEGKTYDLPTEAEWEYACRAGTTTRFWCGDADDSLQNNANIADASLRAKAPGYTAAVIWDDGYAFTSPVGTYKANLWGLYDMAGNVWQWCGDDHGTYQEGHIKDQNNGNNGNNRVMRGGSWDTEPRQCRSARRLTREPAISVYSHSFRVALRFPASQRPRQKGDLSGPTPPGSVENPAEITNTVGLKLKLIQPGTFLMGSPKEEQDRDDNEGPQHEVEITKAFYMGVYPVTRAQFAAFVQDSGYQTDAEKGGKGGNGLTLAKAKWEQKPECIWLHPGFPQGDDHPVVVVSWNDVTAYCAWLSKKEGKTYDLPTEAEWEYACRAGTTTRFWCGDAYDSLKGNANVADAALREKSPGVGWAIAWNDGYAFTSPVGALKPNPWGLHDMHGNVWQWCADWSGAEYQEGLIKDPKGAASGTRRVIRGGSWFYEVRHCRSAHRRDYAPEDGIDNLGFRVVLRLTPTQPPRQTGEAVWLKEVAALHPDQQVQAVAARLKDLNPGFDGKLEYKIEDGQVVSLEFATTNVNDISPVRALAGLQSLACQGVDFGRYGKLTDLSPLKGMKLTTLRCYYNPISDLSPLKDMKLTGLNCGYSNVSDLSPLKDMKLTSLSCNNTGVSDLSPLKDMKLTYLDFYYSKVADLSPLKDMNLTALWCAHTPVSDLSLLKAMKLTDLRFENTGVSDLSPLKELPLRYLQCDFQPKRDTAILRSIKTLEAINGKPAADFWKEVDANK